MKKCPSCNIEKPLSDFVNNRSKRDGKSTYCRICQKVFKRKHYEKNIDEYKEKNKAYKKNIKNFVLKLKTESTCSECNESHPATLDFHHIDRKSKLFSIAEAYKFGSLNLLKIELEKCVVLCSNCHRKLHWKVNKNE